MVVDLIHRIIHIINLKIGKFFLNTVNKSDSEIAHNNLNQLFYKLRVVIFAQSLRKYSLKNNLLFTLYKSFSNPINYKFFERKINCQYKALRKEKEVGLLESGRKSKIK